MKKPLPDLPVANAALIVHVALPDHTPVSPRISRHYFIKFAYLVALLLTLIGACSDGAQKLFGSGQVFGLDDLNHDIEHTSGTLERLGLAYMLIGAFAAFIQSISLEKGFTQNFIFTLFRLTDIASATPKDKGLSDHPLFKSSIHLAWHEHLSLSLIRVSGATVRGITSIMGYRTISNNLSLSIILPPALVDAGQTIATEGIFLKNQYLLLRLVLKSRVFPKRYDPAFLTALRAQIDRDDYCCHSNGGTALYLSCMAIGTLAVLGDVGLAKLVLDSFAQSTGLDADALSFRIPQFIGLTSLFLLVSVIDSKSLADCLSRRFEQPTRAEAPAVIDTPRTHPLLIGLAGLTSILGASITALGAYEGNCYLLTQFDFSADSMMVLSVLVAVLKGCQSLAVEGCYTLKGALDSQWQPSCHAFDRVISAFSRMFTKDPEVPPLFDVPAHPYATLI